jgi:hypothetical protein
MAHAAVRSNSLDVNAPRQGIFSVCAGWNACNATVAHLWAGEAAFIPLLSIGIAWQRHYLGSTLCPTLCCCLLAPTDMHRLDQLPACWGLIEAIGHGWKQGTGREHSRPLQWLHLTLHSLHACHYMHSTSYLSSLPSLTPCKASLSFLLQTCSRSACDLTLE